MEHIKLLVVKLKNAIIANTYNGFDLGGHPVLIWNTDGYFKIDQLLEDFINDNKKR